jgi:hypothetical protein
MKLYIKIFLIALTIGVFTLIAKREAYASEGFVELRSTVGQDTRCWASSLLMQDNAFTVTISCRDLIYPADVQVKRYIVWAVPTTGKDYINLGELEYGKRTFRTDKPFSTLLVSTETNPGRAPAGTIVMRGNIQPISFLQRPTTPTPTTANAQISGSENQQTDQNQAAKTLTTREKLVAAFKKAGVAALLALIALIGLIFVITRSRG